MATGNSLAIFRSPSDAEPLLLDVILEPSTSHRVEISRYPIETGASAVDHSMQAPRVFRFRGLIVNEPYDPLAIQQRSTANARPADSRFISVSEFTIGIGDNTDPLKSARARGPQVDAARATSILDELREIQAKREPVQIFTHSEDIPYAMITDLDERPSGKGGYEVSGTIEEVRFATSREVAAAPQKTPASSRRKKSLSAADQGPKGKSEVTETPTKVKSFGAMGLDKAKALLQSLAGGG